MTGYVNAACATYGSFEEHLSCRSCRTELRRRLAVSSPLFRTGITPVPGTPERTPEIHTPVCIQLHEPGQAPVLPRCYNRRAVSHPTTLMMRSLTLNGMCTSRSACSRVQHILRGSHALSQSWGRTCASSSISGDPQTLQCHDVLACATGSAAFSLLAQIDRYCVPEPGFKQALRFGCRCESALARVVCRALAIALSSIQ